VIYTANAGENDLPGSFALPSLPALTAPDRRRLRPCRHALRGARSAEDGRQSGPSQIWSRPVECSPRSSRMCVSVVTPRRRTRVRATSATHYSHARISRPRHAAQLTRKHRWALLFATPSVSPSGSGCTSSPSSSPGWRCVRTVALRSCGIAGNVRRSMVGDLPPRHRRGAGERGTAIRRTNVVLTLNDAVLIVAILGTSPFVTAIAMACSLG